MKLLLLILLLCNLLQLKSQQKTFIKTNILGLAVRNYTVEFERTLNKKFTVGVNIRYMPNGGIPLADRVGKYIDPTDVETLNALNNALISGSALSPEIRYYVGKKGFGKGFYLGGYFRSNTVKIDFLPFTVDDGSGNTRSVKTAGTFKTTGPGFLIGTQFNLGKKMVLDWQILGVQYSSTTATITANPNPSLTTTEQNDINSALQGFNIAPFSFTSSVSPTRVFLELKGKAPMVRTGLSLGFKF